MTASIFLSSENGDTGVMTLAAVLMNALCSFSQRSLIMEGAVAGNGPESGIVYESIIQESKCFIFLVISVDR